jgi:hypothetical protein
MIWLRASFAVLSVALLGATVRAAGELHEGLPPDTLGFVELDPTAFRGAVPGDQGGILGLGIDAMQSFGVLPEQASVITDAIGLASVAGNHRSCVAVLDAQFATDPPGSVVCKSSQLVWVIDTGGRAEESKAIVEKLTRVLDHYSTRATVKQELKKTAESNREFVQLRDTRWPEWLTLAWTQQGNQFVLTLGGGAMEHFLADRPVGGIPWADTVAAEDAKAKQLGEEAAGGKIVARAYVSSKAFRERFPVMGDRSTAGQVMKRLEMDKEDAGLLTARLKGRVISIDHASIAPGRTTVEPWTVPVNGELLKGVPKEATAYLAIKMDWEKFFDRVSGVCDVVLKTSADDPIAKQAETFAARQGVELRKDILRKLSPVVLVHDSPAHPLKLPLMVTAVGAGEPGIDKTIAKVLSPATAMLDATATKKSAWVRFRLRNEKDNITFMQFGLVGPAWTWSDNKWLFSWSPAAVRYNLPTVKTLDTGAFALPEER